MRLISVPDGNGPAADEQVFYTSAVRDIIVCVIFFILLSGCTGYYTWYLINDPVPWWGHLVYLWFLFWFGFMFLLAWYRYRATRLPGNWLVRSSSDRVLVKFRSFQNYQYDENDRVVIELPWHDIDWMRKTKESSYKDSADDRATVTEYFTYLDIKLRLSDEDLQQIDVALQEERRRAPPRSVLSELRHELFMARKNKSEKFEIEAIKEKIRQEKNNKAAIKKSGTKYRDYPVRLTHTNILRIRWNAVKPKIKPALAHFSQHTTIEPEIKIETDSSSDALKGKELDDMILERIARGDKFDAMALVKKHYGYGTTEAKKFVEDLTGIKKD